MLRPKQPNKFEEDHNAIMTFGVSVGSGPDGLGVGSVELKGVQVVIRDFWRVNGVMERSI